MLKEKAGGNKNNDCYNNKNIYKVENPVCRDYFKCIHVRIHTHTCTHKHNDDTKLNLHNFRRAVNRLETDEDSSMEQKTWQAYSFGKGNVSRLHLNKSREGFCQRGRRKSFHGDGLKTENAWESGARNLGDESIKSRTESTGGCVRLKTFTEKRRELQENTREKVDWTCHQA